MQFSCITSRLKEKSLCDKNLLQLKADCIDRDGVSEYLLKICFKDFFEVTNSCGDRPLDKE